MGEPGNVVIMQLCYDDDRANEPVEGVLYSPNESDPKTNKYYTINLEPGQRFHDNEITYENESGMEIRIIHPLKSMLGLALANGIRNFYVKPGSVVLYLAKDESSIVTISHLSDIVGKEGRVFVAAAHKAVGDGFDALSQLRTNVRYLVGADTTNPSQCKECLDEVFTGQVDTLYSDVGRHDQVYCLSAHASLILENGGFFVAFIKANQMVYINNRSAVIPNDSIFRFEMNKLKDLNFKRVEAKSLGQLASDLLCVVGSFNP